MHKYSISILFILLLASCDSNSSSTLVESESTPNIVGEWNWIKNFNGIGGSVSIPLAGTRIKLIFSSDGKYAEYKRDSLMWVSNNTIGKRKTIYSSDSLDVLTFVGVKLEDKVVVKMTKDSLFLGNTYNGEGSVYLKLAK